MKKGDKGYSTLAQHYNSTLGNAKKRNIKFNIDFKTFASTVIKPCRYCGFKGNLRNCFLKVDGTCSSYYADITEYSLKNGFIILNGIDRVNNTKGYIKNNIVSCCYDCNRAKSDLSFKDWNAYLKRIVKFNRRFYGR